MVQQNGGKAQGCRRHLSTAFKGLPQRAYAATRRNQLLTECKPPQMDHLGHNVPRASESPERLPGARALLMLPEPVERLIRRRLELLPYRALHLNRRELPATGRLAQH